MTWYDRHPGSINPFGYFHTFADTLQEFGSFVRIPIGQVGLVPVDLVRNKYTHLQISFGHGGCHLLLDGNIPVFHPVVFKGRKSLIRHKFQLGNWVFAGGKPEHPQMGCILELESGASGRI